MQLISWYIKIYSLYFSLLKYSYVLKFFFFYYFILTLLVLPNQILETILKMDRLYPNPFFVLHLESYFWV